MTFNPFQINIRSERLALEPISESHAEAIFLEFTDEITRFMYPKPSENIDEVLKFINDSLHTMKASSNLQLVITNIQDSEFLGCIGLHHINRKDPELGIWLKKTAQCKGFGMEAIISLIQWAKHHLNFDYFKYPVDKSNIASKKIPIALGGIVNREFKAIALSGNELDLVEYWIYNNSKHE